MSKKEAKTCICGTPNNPAFNRCWKCGELFPGADPASPSGIREIREFNWLAFGCGFYVGGVIWAGLFFVVINGGIGFFFNPAWIPLEVIGGIFFVIALFEAGERDFYTGAALALPIIALILFSICGIFCAASQFGH